MLVVRLLLRGRDRCCEVGDQGIDSNKTRTLLPYLQQQIVVIPAIASYSSETDNDKLLTLLPYLQHQIVVAATRQR